jgi:hypothetical protein
METLGNNLEIKTSKTSSSFFVCELCDYKCCRKFNLDRHVLSSRHIKEISRKEKGAKNEQNEQITDFTCEQCNKIYKTNAGLWKHKKLCNNVITQNIESSKTNEIHELKEIMKYLIKENTEMKIMMMDVIKTGTNNTTNNNTNSHNKTFNLNLFLNETCKDALNISDFVSSIKVSLSDLENTGRQGYVEGISNIILKNLNNLEQYQRPIHCSDFKREVIYIKDNDKWEKEGEEKPLLTKAIKVIANENIKKIMEWKETNPDCTNSESKKNNLYLKIVSNSMNGLDKEEGTKNITKIISNVAKETIIQKENSY